MQIIKNLQKKIVVQVFAQELQVLQYTKRNETKTVFPRPDQTDPWVGTRGCNVQENSTQFIIIYFLISVQIFHFHQKMI